MTPRNAVVYIGVKINTHAVRQIGESHPIPQSRFGRVDQQKRINRRGGIIRLLFLQKNRNIDDVCS